MLPGEVRWQPVLLGGLFSLTGRSSWSLGEPRAREAGIAEVQRRAGAYGLPPVRWPEPWPGNYLTAMRAATFASAAGAGQRFATVAFRAAFQRGVDLSVAEAVFDLAGGAGLARGELEAACGDPAVKAQLRTATEAAHRAGVFGVPTVALAGEIYWGDDRLEEAAVRLAAIAAEVQ